MSSPAAALIETTESAEKLAERQLQALSELIGHGLLISRAVAERASEPEADLNAAAMAHARVARAVRMGVLLQSRLMREQRMHEASAERDILRAVAEAQEAGRERVARIVGRVIANACEDADEAETLANEAYERIDDDDIYGDVSARPVGEVVALICKDLGVEPDWNLFADERWMQDANLTRPPPLAGEGDPKGGGGMVSHFPMSPQSLRDSSPASGGARITA